MVFPLIAGGGNENENDEEGQGQGAAAGAGGVGDSREREMVVSVSVGLVFVCVYVCMYIYMCVVGGMVTHACISHTCIKYTHTCTFTYIITHTHKYTQMALFPDMMQAKCPSWSQKQRCLKEVLLPLQEQCEGVEASIVYV